MLDPSQGYLPGFEVEPEVPPQGPNYSDYDYILLPFSGGKDSLYCLLYLLEEGVPKDKISLLHHRVDGAEGSELMDWPCTDAYVRAVAAALGVEVFFSWRRHGFEGELNRTNAQAHPVSYELPDRTIVTRGGERSTINTRRKFPQVTANLAQRWCSSALKISVCDMLITGQDRFLNKKTLVVTGERAEESSARAKYRTFEPHRVDNRNGARVKRYVDHFRPAHSKTEAEVWEMIRKYRVQNHPCYNLTWPRASCLLCVFLSKNQWATVRKYMPQKFIPIRNYEREFGVTIHRTMTVDEQADQGVPSDVDPYWLNIAMSKEFTIPVIVENWQMPVGAFGEAGGPT